MTRGARVSSEKYMDTEAKESDERGMFPGMEIDNWNAVVWPTCTLVSQKRTDVLTVGDIEV